jgi:MFS family permease
MRDRHAITALRHRDFRLFAIGSLISNLGTWAQYVGIGWAAREFTDSEMLLGVAFASQFAASLLLSPLAGVVADRFDRRWIVIIGNVAMVVPPALVGILVQTGDANITNLIALVFVGGIGFAFTQPAAAALIPSLVPAESAQQAIALNGVITHGTRIIGPGLGAAAIGAWGIAGGFYVNASSFLAVVIACFVLSARPGRPEFTSESFVFRLRAGMDYARQRPVVGWVLIIVGVATFLAMQAPLMPIFAKDVLGGGVGTYAALSAAPGVGAIGGLVFAGEIRRDRTRKIVIVGSVIAIGVALCTIAVSRSVPLSVGALGLFGSGYFMLATVGTTMLVEASSNEYRGRVMGLFATVSAGMVPVTSILAGVIASVIGATWTVGACGVATLTFVAWLIATRRVRHLSTG